MLVAAFPLFSSLPPASRIILSSSGGSPTVPALQRCVQENIRPWMAVSLPSSLSSTPSSGAAASPPPPPPSTPPPYLPPRPAGRFLSAAVPPQPRDTRFDPGRRMAALSPRICIHHQLADLIIKLLMGFATPRPLYSVGQLTHPHQPAAPAEQLPLLRPLSSREAGRRRRDESRSTPKG